MEVLVFVYNIILIFLFVAACTLAFFYSRMLSPGITGKRLLYSMIAMLFLVTILDNTIIYMTEFIGWFAQTYDSKFMTIPAFKTIILIAQFSLMFLICNQVLGKATVWIHYMILIALAIFLMFIPMMRDSAYKVWLYYFPISSFLMCLCIYGLKAYKDNEKQYQGIGYKYFKVLLKFVFVFAILILIEDTIVIFNFDVYSDIMIRINNRNFCQDMLYVIFSIFTIRYVLVMSMRPVENAVAEEQEKNSEDLIMESFCQKYQMTKRECDIAALLLAGKSNQDICDELYISIGTAKTHIHNIFGKLDVKKRSQAFKAYQEFINGR